MRQVAFLLFVLLAMGLLLLGCNKQSGDGDGKYPCESCTCYFDGSSGEMPTSPIGVKGVEDCLPDSLPNWADTAPVVAFLEAYLGSYATTTGEHVAVSCRREAEWGFANIDWYCSFPPEEGPGCVLKWELPVSVNFEKSGRVIESSIWQNATCEELDISDPRSWPSAEMNVFDEDGRVTLVASHTYDNWSEDGRLQWKVYCEGQADDDTKDGYADDDVDDDDSTPPDDIWTKVD